MGILKIGGATPQLVHNFKPIRHFFRKLSLHTYIFYILYVYAKRNCAEQSYYGFFEIINKLRSCPANFQNPLRLVDFLTLKLLFLGN